MSTPISYTIQTAAEATGLSVDAIRRAVNSGDLAATRPTITKDGQARKISRDVIMRADLERWLTGRAA